MSAVHIKLFYPEFQLLVSTWICLFICVSTLPQQNNGYSFNQNTFNRPQNQQIVPQQNYNQQIQPQQQVNNYKFKVIILRNMHLEKVTFLNEEYISSYTTVRF